MMCVHKTEGVFGVWLALLSVVLLMKDTCLLLTISKGFSLPRAIQLALPVSVTGITSTSLFFFYQSAFLEFAFLNLTVLIIAVQTQTWRRGFLSEVSCDWTVLLASQVGLQGAAGTLRETRRIFLCAFKTVYSETVCHVGETCSLQIGGWRVFGF